jgi:hypothetical protein
MLVDIVMPHKYAIDAIGKISGRLSFIFNKSWVERITTYKCRVILIYAVIIIFKVTIETFPHPCPKIGITFLKSTIPELKSRIISMVNNKNTTGNTYSENRANTSIPENKQYTITINKANTTNQEGVPGRRVSGTNEDIYDLNHIKTEGGTSMRGVFSIK